METKTEKQIKGSNQKLQRAAVAVTLFWNNIDWGKTEKSVVSIQRRIVEAINNDSRVNNKIEALQDA